MADDQAITKANFLKRLDDAWEKLNTFLNGLTESRMTEVKDADGWTVKDHLSHMAAWERSVVCFLQGKPGYEGLGVDEALYESGDLDETNAAIHREQEDVSLEDARRQLNKAHSQFLKQLEPLTDADLQKPFRPYRPDEQGEGEGPTLIYLLYGNSAGHFDEHVDWMRAMIDEADGK